MIWLKFAFIAAISYWKRTFLLLDLISNDGLLGALDQLHYSHTRETKPFIKRYIYYVIVSALYVLGDILTWFQLSDLLYWIILLGSISPLLDEIMSINITCMIVHWCYDKIWSAAIIYTCDIFASIVNGICVVVLQMDPQITASEIKTYITENNMPNIANFIKSFIMASMIKYYRQVIGIIVQCDIKAGSQIRAIIYRRRWDELSSPENLACLIAIYSETNSNKLIAEMQYIFDAIQYATFNFFAIYAFVNLFPDEFSPIVIFVASLLIDWFNHIHIDYINVLLRIVISTLSIGGVILTIFLVETVPFVGPILATLCKHWAKMGLKFFAYYEYNMAIIRCMILFALCSDILILLAVMLNLTDNIYIYVYFLVFGCFSQYSLLHTLSLGVILYMTKNIYNFPHNVDIDIIDDYRG